MHWFNRVMVYFVNNKEVKWTTRQLREIHVATKCREIGYKSKNDDTKEKEYREAIQHYEIVIQKFKPPSLKKIISKFLKQEKDLTERQSKYQDKYGKFLKLLNNALQPGPKFKVHRLDSTYYVHSNGEISFDRKYVDSLRKLARKKGIFSAVLEMIHILVKPYEPENRFDIAYDLLLNFNQYCQRPDGPRTIIKRKKEEKDA